MDIELAQALAENELLKSLLYCTKRSCNNCGKVNCENFQRQRKDCCGNWVSYKDYIKKLEAQIDKTKNAFKKIIKTVHNDNISGYGDRLVIIYDISCEVLQSKKTNLGTKE
jgi:hypothetical protein